MTLTRQPEIATTTKKKKQKNTMHRLKSCVINVLVVFLVLGLIVKCGDGRVMDVTDCEVVIAGGSTAALSAAIASSSEGVNTCLIEPTDWIGGQLTSSAVSAIDFAWHTLKDPKTNKTFEVWKVDRDPANITPNFYKALQEMGGDSGKCWVSIICYLPRDLLEKSLHPMQDSLNATLRVFLNTVVKSVERKGDRIISLRTIQRNYIGPETTCNGYDRFLSNDIMDWYSESDSDRFHKNIIQFSSSSPMVFIDGTEWGEILALSRTSYLQGISERFDGDTSGIGIDTCGQSVVFGFSQYYSQHPISEPPNPYPVKHEDFYSLTTFTWDQVWTYRRLFTMPSGKQQIPEPGDITLQNWGKGNDFEFGYIFKSRNETDRDVISGNWCGGIDLDTIREAEYLAYGWHYKFKEFNKDVSQRDRIILANQTLGTCHKLSKVPYIRDTRRSIGIGDFLMNITDISGDFTKSLTGHRFFDHVAIGAYTCDIHPLSTCKDKYPSYMLKHYDILPFYIPFRALTNREISNLLVAGKTMAQSFLVNAASRLHPIEWSSGTAAGVSAAFMVKQHVDSTQAVLNQIEGLQERVKIYTPIDWTIRQS